MLFNSLIFLLFAGTFLLFMPAINRLSTNLRLLFILSASLFFYGWWNWQFIFLLLFTGLVDFAGALAIERWKRQRVFFLAASMLANLGVLVFYKYALFFLKVWTDVGAGSQTEMDSWS